MYVWVGFAILCAVGSWQEVAETEPQAIRPGAIQKIRKVYVPQDDVEKLIKGRYLPVELEKLGEFFKNEALKELEFATSRYEL
ncbi:MAG: hypothetical protein VX438_06990, partial [Planctomycetota bacterium]|nr:hypothetical protein [Planctomycetota bacterium]